MLVLSRKQEEQILIGDDIVITIVKRTRGGGVRVGVTAPKDVVILRGELAEKEPQSSQDKGETE